MATISGEVRDDAGDLVADVVVRAYRRDTGALLVAGVSGDGSEEVPGDADYASVSLLLHCDGTDGSTTFTDNSGTPKTVTVYGNAHIETDQSKFGGASAYFDGNGDYATFPTSSAFDFGSGDFTFECWIRPAAVGADADVCTTNGATNGCGIRISSNRKVSFIWNIGGSSLSASSTTLLSANTWYHVAGVRSGTNTYLFLDGVLEGTTACGTGTQANPGVAISIGRNTANSSWYYNGYLDELRITKGVARYTASFTPPAVAFPDVAMVPAKPLGEYTLTTDYTDEVNVIALDPDGGTTFNDLILRTTPV